MEAHFPLALGRLEKLKSLCCPIGVHQLNFAPCFPNVSFYIRQFFDLPSSFSHFLRSVFGTFHWRIEKCNSLDGMEGFNWTFVFSERFLTDWGENAKFKGHELKFDTETLGVKDGAAGFVVSPFVWPGWVVELFFFVAILDCFVIFGR